MSKRTTSAVWVRGIAEMLAAEGLDVEQLFAAAKIDATMLDKPGGRLPSENISHLWELAVQKSGNPALSLAQPGASSPARSARRRLPYAGRCLRGRQGWCG